MLLMATMAREIFIARAPFGATLEEVTDEGG
jgi:hypothetical protein